MVSVSMTLHTYTCTILLLLHRGDSFRSEFLRIGEIRSILPPDVHMMALTATASSTLHISIIKTLGMYNTALVNVSPDKVNIRYEVSPFSSIEDSFSTLIHDITRNKTEMGRVIIFCSTFDDCAKLYLLFRTRLGWNFLHPSDAPDLYQNFD